jgi:hypothetical protein
MGAAVEGMRMKRIITVGTGLVVGAVGTAAYFLDPRSGKKRRAAVKRQSTKVARRSAHVAAMMGGGGGGAERPHAAAVRSALEELLGDTADGLGIIVSDEAVTVRGEVMRMSDIAAVSRILADLAPGLEVVNLVRLRSDRNPTATG